MILNLGCDPEFLLINPNAGTIINPHSFIQDIPHGEMNESSAIGVDGNRITSSVELRPGIHPNPEVLVNRMGDLLAQLKDHVDSPRIAYKAGAYYGGEYLGGHIHISWEAIGHRESVLGAYCSEFMQAMAMITDVFHSTMFIHTEIDARRQSAGRHDWGKPQDYRPDWKTVLHTRHLEYRYPASWLMYPEIAYCFLGSTSIIGNLIFNTQDLNKLPKWATYINELLHSSELTPVGQLSIAKAFKQALHLSNKNKDPNLKDTWE